MSSQTDVCNNALTLLGAATINAITDQTNQAITLNAIWDLERQSELRKHIWKFSIVRAQLALLSTAPVNGPYTQAFALPAGLLRILQVGDSNYDYPGVDLSDYRVSPTLDDYVIEGNTVLSNLAAPLSLRYIQDVPDVTQWDACFSSAFAARLAERSCFRITQSHDGEKVAMARYKQDMMEAVRANALETPPTVQGDDTWVATRPVGSGGAAWIRYG